MAAGPPSDSSGATPSDSSGAPTPVASPLADVTHATPGTSSPLAANGIPATALDAYQRAAAASPGGCHIGWALIAAIGRVESNHGRFRGAVLHEDGQSSPPILGIALNGSGTALIRDTDDGTLDKDTVFDRAVGPMQFIPSTWRRYAADGNGDGREDPFNIYDAARGAAHYLCSAGGDLSTDTGKVRAVLAYNHSASYVATILALAATYEHTVAPTLSDLSLVPAPAVPPANPGAPPAITNESAAVTAAQVPASPSVDVPAPSTTSASTSPATTSAPASTSASAPGTTTPSTTTPSSTTPSSTTPSSTTPSSTPAATTLAGSTPLITTEAPTTSAPPGTVTSQP